ncbi:MAG TPA: HAMP domain-containing sensor histidine kinase [Solirubrobacteraceae bacterium]|nr:HAMP domain-containing sensor histidine kinase [Solirubrobacteraceae bacterium]
MRLAGVSALLTFVILCAFAVAIGSLTVHRIRSDFNRQVAESAHELPAQLRITIEPLRILTPLADFTANGAIVKVMTLGQKLIAEEPGSAPYLGPPSPNARTIRGFRVVSQTAVVTLNSTGQPVGRVLIEYARPVGPTEKTVKRVELFLLLGVIAGSVLAAWAGWMIARRAMRPIAALTSTAAEIARTRDPSRSMPQPQADDEVAELTRTLEGMLRELDAARSETETMLARQRRFVADASHELRTPLTSVLANLELLADSLQGDQGEAARSALRSSQRMRRLVADLLLLARTDAARSQPREQVDLGTIVVEAAAELGPVSTDHEIVLDAHSAPLLGVRDELHRLTINLIENALRHTPPGTEVRVRTDTLPDGRVELVVADNGPGVPPELAPTLFERFIRGAGDRGGSFGLGLAIVMAVATSHGGTVTLASPEPFGPGEQARGARFVVRLPGVPDAQRPQPQEPVLADRAV